MSYLVLLHSLGLEEGDAKPVLEGDLFFLLSGTNAYASMEVVSLHIG